MRSANRLRTAIAAAALLCTGVLGAAPEAAAADYGGDGNPSADCAGGQTIASANIVNAGTVVGVVEMRWSWACSGNWTRTTSYVGTKTLESYTEVPRTGRNSRAVDTGTSNWSPYLRVAPSERVCSWGRVFINDNLRVGATVCSS
ncbi:hypothetical protein [Streptomyces sp. SID9727]|uniref:hypothetical protein n=1 Tax=Streptomyces sp. SID9727 TaxID=2706114 RepID=UPI0013C8844E|nr:hypothetical protein [Streptomyces sp. SID9727]NEC68751.1 hypothetical protein [Streptomyces sp. SID9727]